MSTRVDVEDIEITPGERLLGLLLAVFILVGLLWAYYELDIARDGPPTRNPITQLSAAERAALDRVDTATQSVLAARARVRERRDTLDLRREAYRTALDEGRSAPDLEAAYSRAEARYADAVELARRREAELRAAEAAAAPVRAELARLEREQMRAVEAAQRDDRRLTAGLRLALVLAAVGLSLGLMSWQRRRRSRWVVAGRAAVGAAAALALVMGVDYVTDWFDPVDLGPLVLSLAGSALTLVAVAGLQRHLARRLPGRRVRRGECPFCGYPSGRGDHCEGCGRSVVAPCARCAAPRRVGTPHCAACGQT